MHQILIAAALWISLRIIYLKMFNSDSGCLVYGTFGFAVSRIIEYHFYQNPTMLDFNRFGSSGLSRFEEIIVAMSAGYFLCTIPAGIYKKEQWYLQIHHLLCTTVTSSAIYYDNSGFDIIIIVWVGEFTSPCAYWIFLYEDQPLKYNTKFMIVDKIVYFILFLIFRFGFGPFLLYKLLMSPGTLFTIKFGGILMTCFNCVVLFKAMKEIKGHFQNKKKE